jgi:hypothetical protein
LVEALDLLDGVARGGQAHGAAHDGVQVDEAVLAEQAIDLGFACAVGTHQPLERAALVGGVVIDMRAGMGGQVGDD